LRRRRLGGHLTSDFAAGGPLGSRLTAGREGSTLSPGNPARIELPLFESLFVIVLAGLIGPVIAAGRRPVVPAVVGELVAGIVLGRTGLAIVNPETPTNGFLYALGFAMLMLVAGSHVRLDGSLSAGLRSAAVAFGIVLVLAIPLGLVVAIVLAPSAPAALFPILLAGSSAAVAFPILEERGLLGPSVALLLAWIPLADAVTVLVMPLTLIGTAKIPAALAGDAAIIIVTAAVLLVGVRVEGVQAALTLRDRSRSRGWALQLRLSLIILIGLTIIATQSGGSTLLAGFGAGLVLSRLRTPERLEMQLSGIAEGFFVPAFFVLLGAQLDFRALAGDPQAIALAVAMGAGAVAIHVVASRFTAPKPRAAFGLAASAQLGLPAAAASLGLATGHLSAALAAGVVAAGCITVLPASFGTRALADSLRDGAAPGAGGAKSGAGADAATSGAGAGPATPGAGASSPTAGPAQPAASQAAS
jgi:Kef-type K+ transport system membrane component KefB